MACRLKPTQQNFNNYVNVNAMKDLFDGCTDATIITCEILVMHVKQTRGITVSSCNILGIMIYSVTKTSTVPGNIFKSLLTNKS